MTKFILGLLAYTGMVFGNTDIIMRDTNSDLCLSFSNSEAMVAFDPVNGTTNNYPSAMWVSCNSTDEEFQLTTDNQIVGPGGRCLTILPIDDVFHVNLDSCDTWTNLPGAGSYLFHVECQSPPVQSQQWTYDSGNKEFTSFCPHGLFLGEVGNSTIGFNAFVTSTTGSFASAVVLSGFEPKTTTAEVISQKQSNAIPAILALDQFTSVAEFSNLEIHGCWCSKILGTNPDHLGAAADDMDRECKLWHTARKCISITDGSCHNYDSNINPSQYVIEFDNSNGDHNCDVAGNTNTCLIDSCKVDAYYADRIKTLLLQNTFSGTAMDSAECSRNRPQGGAGGNGSGGNGGSGSSNSGPGSVVTQRCFGDVPAGIEIISDS